MKKFTIICGAILLLLGIKTALILTDSPKPTVDYVAEYNKITRPANYDPNNDAAGDYQKALDAYVKMPPERSKLLLL